MVGVMLAVSFLWEIKDTKAPLVAPKSGFGCAAFDLIPQRGSEKWGTHVTPVPFEKLL